MRGAHTVGDALYAQVVALLGKLFAQAQCLYQAVGMCPFPIAPNHWKTSERDTKPTSKQKANFALAKLPSQGQSMDTATTNRSPTIMTQSPETTEWVRALLSQEIERAIAPLRQEIDRLDDWSNGVFAALSELLRPLLAEHPEIAATLASSWRRASEVYDTLGSEGQAADFHETQELLEARKILFRLLPAFEEFRAPGLAT